MFHQLITQLNLALAGHSQAIIAVIMGAAMMFCFSRSLQAWKDIVRLDKEQYHSASEQLLRPLSEKLRPHSEVQIRQLKTMLTRAGMRQSNAVERYTALRVTSIIVGAAAALGCVLLGMDALHVLVAGSACLFCGWAYPDFSLRQRIEARQAKIAAALPSMVDLMVLCLDVGLSLEAAFERVTAEIADLEPLMAEEASQMLSEMSSGVTFPNALKRMADRIGLDELMTLARLISQASVMGASIARALREYSDSAFQKRMIALEEKAGKITSMMVLPVTACMLPAAMIALVGPAVLMLVKMIAAS